jgi:hypothetical protein
MNLMERRIEYGRFLVVQEPNGEMRILPEEFKSDPAVIGKGKIVETRYGWGAYLTAPGYLDQTEIVLCDTAQEANDALYEGYGDDEDDEEEEDCEEYEAPVSIYDLRVDLMSAFKARYPQVETKSFDFLGMRTESEGFVISLGGKEFVVTLTEK